VSARPLELRWTDAALSDVVEVLAYVALDDAAAAGRLEDRLFQTAAGIVPHPDRGRVVPELRAIGLGTYREVVVAPYRVVYRATPRVLYVVAVLHGARDLETTLFRRLTRPQGGAR
jgi:toxin ParE1/3/4